jgi:exodeoxyribonuclease VII small subunit
MGGEQPGAGNGRTPDDLGYEQARDQLVDVVRRLESGGATLEESLALWEQGEALAKRCEDWLAGARRRVEAQDVEAQDVTEEPHPASVPTSGGAPNGEGSG